MIKLTNPTTGAPINDIYTDSDGKSWKIDLPVDATFTAPEPVANYLLERFGFLEQAAVVEADVREEGMFYCKNNCGFSSKAQIATHNHEKKCDETVAKQATYVRPVENGGYYADRPTIEVSHGPSSGSVDGDGVEWYGGGLQADKPTMGAMAPIGTKGHFGA